MQFYQNPRSIFAPVLARIRSKVLKVVSVVLAFNTEEFPFMVQMVVQDIGIVTHFGLADLT